MSIRRKPARKAKLGDLIERMVQGAAGACNCETKSHELTWHYPLCRYRLLAEAALEIERLRNEVDKLRNEIAAEKDPPE